MAEEKELARLEGFVSTLLEKFNALRADHKGLTERLQRRDASIENLEDELASMKDDRSEVSTRVSSLIGQIEEWESSTDIDDESTMTDEPTELDEDDGADEADYTVGAEEEKKDSAVQGNLFNPESSDV